jgi:hypothetical protein
VELRFISGIQVVRRMELAQNPAVCGLDAVAKRKKITAPAGNRIPASRLVILADRQTDRQTDRKIGR